MKRKDISELVDYLENLQYDEVVYFKDDNLNQFWLYVEENWISADDSIPEDQLTEEDMEFFSHAKIQSEDYAYRLASEIGDTVQEAATLALYALELIDDETLNRFISQG
jgi:hypothetical protein